MAQYFYFDETHLAKEIKTPEFDAKKFLLDIVTRFFSL